MPREITDLPAWGQKLVRDAQAAADLARRNLEYYEARAAATLEGSAVIADPYSDSPRPLGNPLVKFGNKDVYFMVEFDAAEGILHVTGNGYKAINDGLAVYPANGNAVKLKGGRP